MQLELPKWMISRIREDFPNISIQHSIKIIIREVINSKEGEIIIRNIIEEEDKNKERNTKGKGITDLKP